MALLGMVGMAVVGVCQVSRTRAEGNARFLKEAADGQATRQSRCTLSCAPRFSGMLDCLLHYRLPTMNIVCIAWGSLLWKPAPLKLASGWHPGGPRLPLEFVRKSDDSPEVALVLCEGARPMPTYWAYLDAASLDAARAMLGEREKIASDRPDYIGSIPALDGGREDARIAAWLRRMRIDAAVWTALPAKFGGQSGRVPTPDEVVRTLGELSPDERAEAERYVRCTPPHIDTHYRRVIAARLGWHAGRDAHVTRMR